MGGCREHIGLGSGSGRGYPLSPCPDPRRVHGESPWFDPYPQSNREFPNSIGSGPADFFANPNQLKG